MRWYSFHFAIVCLVLAALAAGATHAQSVGGIVAWGRNNLGQCNVPAPNADFMAVAGGGYHSLGLKSDGTIVAWGYNGYGQCNVPVSNTDFVAVAGGGYHSLGLKADGTIVAWGLNSDGRCDVPAPNADFVAVAGGWHHSLGLKADGTIVAWGQNDYGRCDVPAPNADFVAVAGGFGHSLGLKSDGTIVAWGQNTYGQCNVPAPNADFVAIAIGDNHSLGLKSDGTIVAWGYNGYGQCNVPAPNANFVTIAGGGMHSLGLKSEGTIVAWGYNVDGACNVPAPNADFVAVAAGGGHSLGVITTPLCIVSQTSIDFGTVFVAEHQDRTFVIGNIGYGPLMGSVSENCDHFSIISGGGPYSIDPGDSIVVTVRFEPMSEGVDTCSIKTGTECSPVFCYGIAQGPLCSVEPPSLDFGFVTIGHNEDLDFILTNTGGGRLTGSIAEACERFSIVTGGGAYDLGRGDTLRVTVRFEALTTETAMCAISTGGGCDTVVCTGTGDRVPRIYAVRDVPGDQGGFINVAWDAAPGDTRAEHVIARYTVWRAISPTTSELSSLDPGSFIGRISDLLATAKTGIVRMTYSGGLIYYWKLISSIDAYYLEGYSEAVPTLFDSTEVCDEYHYVQIIAHASDPYTFWISPLDSGRSVDNLAPAVPLCLAGEQSFVPEGLTLSWGPNRESDLEGYAIYRGVSEDFVPGPGNLAASTPDTLYLDAGWRWDSRYYYKLSARDVHGNESGFALLRPEDVTGSDTPKAPEASYLGQNYPNPFNPLTKIEFGLSMPARVSLRVYDAAGRLVRVLVDEALPAARYEEIWGGRDTAGRQVASGIYFYRLEAGTFRQTRKMILLR